MGGDAQSQECMCRSKGSTIALLQHVSIPMRAGLPWIIVYKEIARLQVGPRKRLSRGAREAWVVEVSEEALGASMPRTFLTCSGRHMGVAALGGGGVTDITSKHHISRQPSFSTELSEHNPCPVSTSMSMHLWQLQLIGPQFF